jgi:hypothetical protein
MCRLLRPLSFAFVCSAVISLAAPAAAQQNDGPAIGLLSLTTAPPITAEQYAAARLAPSPELRPAKQSKRPPLLVPLYASFAGLEALDVQSTLWGLKRGAVEANPLMKEAARNPAGMIAVKAAATTALIYSAERIRRRHPLLAVAYMAGITSGVAMVVHHNYRVVR